jgi:hypothetical protein
VTLEQLRYGLTREWLDNHQICVLSPVGGMSKDAIIHWGSKLIECIGMFKDDQPIRILHDIRAERRTIPPFVRHSAKDLYAQLPQDRPMYGAYVVNPAIVTPLMNAIRDSRPKSLPNIHERIFTDFQHGLDWLRNATP